VNNSNHFNNSGSLGVINGNGAKGNSPKKTLGTSASNRKDRLRQFKEEYENLLKQQKFGKGNSGDQQQSLGQNSSQSNAKMSYIGKIFLMLINIGQGTSQMRQLQSNSDMSRKIESKYEVAIDKAQYYQSEYQDEPEYTNLMDQIMNYEFPEDEPKKSYGYKELRVKCKIYEREDQTYLSKYIGKISYLNSGFLSDVLLRVGDRPSIHTEKLVNSTPFTTKIL
jgi:hypothetical protein